jgi:hypothetical protein
MTINSDELSTFTYSFLLSWFIVTLLYNVIGVIMGKHIWGSPGADIIIAGICAAIGNTASTLYTCYDRRKKSV